MRNHNIILLDLLMTDNLVYELFELTEDEIKIVEGD